MLIIETDIRNAIASFLPMTNTNKTMKPGFIYIITNKYQTVVYTGVTSNLPQRILEHKEKRYPASFSARYNANLLVYYEQFQCIGDAIAREKQIKAGSREAKNELIRTLNPTWNDLFEEIKDIMTE
ncbi:GIY-YIG nuclease family protein [Flavobacterium omnivorum]